jgi:hypothetical protein
MQIHEITKRQRTDEGLLDTVKQSVKASSLGQAVTSTKNTAVNAIKHPFSGSKFQQAQNVSALAQANAIRQQINAKNQKALGDQYKEVGASVRGANQRGELSLDQKLELAKRDPKAKQKIAQLVKAFDQEFDTGPDVQYQKNPDAAKKFIQQKTVAPVQPVKPNTTTQPYTSQTQQNIAAQNRQMGPLSGIREGSLAQRSQNRNAPVAPVQPTQAVGKKDIEEKNFQKWISQHIPGIENIDPTTQRQLDQLFQKIVMAKGNTKAVDAAFEEYATVALAALGAGQGSYNQSSISAASYTQQQAANQLGITPDAIAKLQQRMAQNKEVVKSKTGSDTIDKLITAVTGQ